MSERELERIFREEEDIEKVWEAVEIFLNTSQDWHTESQQPRPNKG